jgi:hypothetical protein
MRTTRDTAIFCHLNRERQAQQQILTTTLFKAVSNRNGRRRYDDSVFFF